MKKKALGLLVAAAVFAACVPAAAETFTASNGVLSIELPNENWKEMPDSTKWISLSDGTNLITIEHFSNGETLPAVPVADEHYVNVFQAAYSTQNEVFYITGSVTDKEKIPEITGAIMSLKVLKFDTKQKVVKEAAPAASEFSVAGLDETWYVSTDGLNVRSGYSTDAEILGALAYGESVHVTGSVKQNGQDYGWYQVEYNGGVGYVSAGFLSAAAPEAKSSTASTGNSGSANTSTGIQYTGNTTTVYAMSGTPVTLYEAVNGNWYDSTGQLFTWLDEARLESEGGEAFTLYNAAAGETLGGLYGENATAYAYCEYCGQWYLEGNEFRNHVCPARDAALGAANSSGSSSDGSVGEMYGENATAYAYCEYCGQWYPEGVEFRNHVCPARDAALGG